MKELVDRLREMGLTNLEIQALLDDPAATYEMLITLARRSAVDKLYIYYMKHPEAWRLKTRKSILDRLLARILRKIKGIIREERIEERSLIEEPETEEEEVLTVKIRRSLL